MIELHEICPEMLKLRERLDDMQIDWIDESDPLTERTALEDCRIFRTHFWYSSDKYSVVYGFGTYGGWNRFTDGADPKLLELMINSEEPTGWRTADDIIKIMKERSETL